MLQNIKGTKDILPSDIGLWQELEQVFRRVNASYSYEEIRTPVMEYADLFAKSAGEGSDVVAKEMYVFEDRSGDKLCLRPELTAPVARTVMQNTMLRANPTLRIWYYGPCFRYERPQLGRQRQFHQIGAECIGSPHPEADAEIIMLAQDVIRECGINDFTLYLNTLGSPASRIAYRAALVEYLQRYSSELSQDSQRRLTTNPLRILDSKDETDRKIIADAPRLPDFLDNESTTHFEKVKSILQKCSVSFEVDSLLVRGLDYYTHTVFEFKTTALGAQDAIGGGGRYDNLFESLQGPAAPGVGFGIGVERLILLAQQNHVAPDNDAPVYIVCDSEFSYAAFDVAATIRSAGIAVKLDVQHRTFKAQMKEADKIGASVVVIIGEQEISTNCLTVKNMKSGAQNSVSYEKEAILDIIRNM